MSEPTDNERTDGRVAESSLPLDGSERQFRLLVAGVVDYALYMLDPEGRVVSWNAGAENIKGYRADEIIGRHFSIFYTEDERAAGRPTAALETARTQGRYEAESWRVRKDGALFWASVVIDAIHDEQGELLGFAKITRDITERRNAQLELAQANERLAQSQKLEALGQLTGGVAHDFNNLLMVVSGNAQLLRRKAGQDERSARWLDAIDLAVQRGEQLTRHLLTFARRQRLHPQAVSLAKQAAPLLDLAQATLGSGTRVEVSLPDDLWPVHVDPGEMELAILNIAVNARDAMPKGGVFRMTATNRAATDTSGDVVELVFEDTGEGIPPDIQARIFEPFFSTKDVSRGAGLGLSQVYGFVQQSGGEVTVESELGQGARIIVTLPRSAAAPTAPGPEARPEAAALPSHGRVLLVEDNPQVAEVTARLLEQFDLDPVVAGNAATALKMLEDGPLPDLLFSDIVMAGEMNGLDLARLVRARWPDLPILLATGYSSAAREIGEEFSILSKPYQISDLNRALNAVRREHPAAGRTASSA